MQKQDKRIQIMQDAPPLKAIFTMSIPVILGMMVNVIYNLLDTWFIGMIGDELQLAASNYCTPIFVIGISATIGQMLISIAQMTCNNLASTYGDVR